MADDSDEERQNAKFHTNQPYDESLDVADAEEVASLYTPTPSTQRDRPDRGHSRGDTPPEPEMSDPADDDDDFDSGPVNRQGQMAAPPPDNKMYPDRGGGEEIHGGTDSSEEDDDEEDGDSDDDSTGQVEGAYDPSEYDNLPVTPDIKELFQYITRYTTQHVELEHKLKPFIPDFIPAVGDIDAFIKVPRPDGKPDSLGLTVLDEPCSQQSDPTVLALKLRECFPTARVGKEMAVKSIQDAEKNPKAVESWINNITELHRAQPLPTVHYTRNMPDIDNLMQEWPAEFEELLKEVGLPTADMDCDLSTYVDIICSLLDIPIYKSKVQSLHVLFTLFSEFKNSMHFQALAEDNRLDNKLKSEDGEESDRLVL